MKALSFQDTQFDVVDHYGQPWLKAADIARALGYKKADAVTQIYDRNSDEFTSAMCQTLNLSVSQNNGILSRETRIFSLRGAHLLAMFARTAIAKAFRKWVLDILDCTTTPEHPDTTLLPDDAVIFSEGRVQQLYWHAWRSYKVIMQQELDHGINEDTLRLHNTWRSMYPRQIVDGIQRDLMLTCYKGLTDKGHPKQPKQ
ncbi:hypothetical protein HA052_24400 [Chromobacterium haemolyticum]|uniref:Bro-N domain-containing protein n=1 Tax=Chromobacterium fluminis TaxID=3044269 RepID=A0ABX0LGI7_9NEIS|nr:BRO family protein [Chromobacterium haemolyticum]NHR08338.1 hypothetical protein [Chromobacterium haemolyticum]